MFDFAVLMSAFLLGLFSSAHCIGMCGGIMGALSMAVPAEQTRRRLFILLCYNLGRLLSYGLMGLLVGLFAQQIMAAGGASVLRWIAGLLLIAMGLYLANWWQGLTRLESLGRYLWAYLQPLAKPLLPVKSPAKGLLLGAIWGWLPCGLVYSALAYSMAQGHWLASTATMLAFGAGTLPSLFAAGVAAQSLGRLLQVRQVRWGVALSIILFGVWTLWGGGAHHDHSATEHPAEVQSPDASHQHQHEHQHHQHNHH